MVEPIDWNPGKLLEISGSYWQACALHAAVKLDIFSTIGDADFDSQRLADTLDCD